MAGGQVKDGLREIKTNGDVVMFITEYKAEESVTFYLEHFDLVDLDARYEDEEHSYSPFESESGTDLEFVAVEGDESESDSVDGTDVLPDQLINPELVVTSDVQALVAFESSKNPDATRLEDFDDENGDSSDLDSICSSDEDTDPGKPKLHKFKLSIEIIFVKGQVFSRAKLIRTSGREFALQQRKNIYVKKSERKRVVVKCVEGFPFYMRFSKAPPKTYFVLTTYYPDDKCHYGGRTRLIRTSLLAKKLIPLLKLTPHMRIKALKDACKERWGVMLSSYQLYRTKKKALELIHGAIDEQYVHLKNYAKELLRSNPNSSVKIKCADSDVGPVFQRIYVCFYACKRAFATTCRPLISLDGCFLKGRDGGHLLAAIEKDGNNQMLPIAFAVVEAETKEA
ncbi:uncharacterized protein [Medicago truncatula]|uniref:uncharacterized protein n=1 Tax=Medicago truncatula TaxID=3880 RepID=UPI000D2F412E|nr:uncharacterized protein LOC112420108 [Medicago truncatula]